MTTPTPRTNAAQQEIDRRAFRRGRVHAPDVFDMADFARQLERELAAAQERAQAAEARVEECEMIITAMTQWLEKQQPDVFRRGLWDAIAEGKK